jgi:hypothetical protein
VRIVHVARKPLAGSVASNVLEHGAGAINIDGTRVAGVVPQVTQGSSSRIYGGGSGLFPEGKRLSQPNPGGRWPANMVLEHLEGCVAVGTRQVKGSQLNQIIKRSKSRSNSIGEQTDGMAVGYTDDQGMETMEAWDCSPGCPLADLEGQVDAVTRFYKQVKR